jgi:molybdopterin-guanine dinucleotide biosynthesis protein A
MTKLAAVILAGGRGERMGGANKALLKFGGRRMIDIALEAVSGCDSVVLSAGDRVFPAEIGIPAENVVSDIHSTYGGPLAGVAAAVEHLSRGPSPEMLLTLAVDTPHFPADFVGRAQGLIADADLVVGAYEGQDYPTNALWRFGALQGLPGRIRQGTAPHSLKRLIMEHRAHRIDYSALTTSDPFANANTPEELAELRARQHR